ncbi:GHKL domain-containing protein [uncultured Eubacterium sp.]|uniref:GHKL domain-containing protein n=1 Tax=uncultured Eubacterium sp. TaxID=165185 RepID=UPI002639A534|nr:GHKL domain-containing protein [uncultured Eubacterium sp.]
MVIKYISLILGALLEVYSANIFISSFSDKRIKNQNQIICIYTIISIYQIIISFLFQGSILLLCSIIMVFLISQIFKSKQYIKLILSVTYIIIGVAGEMLVSGILMIVSSRNFANLNSEPQIYSLGILLSKFITFLIILIVKISKKKFNVNNLGTKYLLILSILPITTIILLFLMYQIMWIIDNNQLKITFIFASILLILSNIITFEIIRNQNKLAKSEYELKLLKENITEQTKHYENLQSSHEEIRQMRHNMRSICIGTIAELKVGRIDSAIEQLKSNIDIIEESSKIIDTGHPSIDSIIENKLNKCDELNINVNLSYQYKKSITINEIEIAVIVGNILDNAIEACQKVRSEKEIWGSIMVDKHDIIINIKNTAVDSNNLKTSKINKKDHGYGLKSISLIAKKYNGYAKFSFSNNIFTSYVVIGN